MGEIVLNTGDTAWVLASTALVLLMTPGLALFYGGMVSVGSGLVGLHSGGLLLSLVLGGFRQFSCGCELFRLGKLVFTYIIY